MAIHDAHVSTQAHDEHVVHVFGEPGDVERTAQGPAVLIAGYDVIKVDDAQHDGQPAKRFTLAVDGITEVGRLVVRTGIPTEYTFEWDLIFDSPEDAKAYVDRIKNPPAKPAYLTATVDFCWDGYDTLEEGIADMSAEHGVSIKVLDLHGPGGGWPVVELFGKPENVYKALTDKKGWDTDEDDMREFWPDVLAAVTPL